MKLPELKEGMVIKCLTSEVKWWTKGKYYPVLESNGYLVIFDEHNNGRCTGADIGDVMTFEVIEPEWDGEGYPPVGIDCMVQFATRPVRIKIHYLGSTLFVYSLCHTDGEPALEGFEYSGSLRDATFTPIKTNRQEAINSIVGNGCYTSYARAESLLDEIIAGKHKWLEYTGGK